MDDTGAAGGAVVGAAPDDALLWNRAAAQFGAWRRGEQSADALVRTMTPVLWHVARACGLSEDDSRDVVQTVWLALVRRRSDIANEQAVAGWLVTSTRREAWRIGRAARTVDSGADAVLDAPDIAVVGRTAPRSTEEIVVGRDEERRLWTAVLELPERCQRLLRIVAFEERPDYARIAHDLNMPVGSIGPTRSRCLQKLRSSLEREGAVRTEGRTS